MNLNVVVVGDGDDDKDDKNNKYDDDNDDYDPTPAKTTPPLSYVWLLDVAAPTRYFGTGHHPSAQKTVLDAGWSRTRPHRCLPMLPVFNP
jgi:hypothetical protein